MPAIPSPRNTAACPLRTFCRICGPWQQLKDSPKGLLRSRVHLRPAVVWEKKYTLAPNETREISFNELIQDKVPDGKGRILSPGRQRGVVNWMVPDSGQGTGRLMVTSRSRGMARNFSCGN